MFLKTKTFTNYGGSGGYIQVRLYKERFFLAEKGHMNIYKGVETYWKNSTPPEEDEGRSGHLKCFTQIDMSKYILRTNC